MAKVRDGVDSPDSRPNSIDDRLDVSRPVKTLHHVVDMLDDDPISGNMVIVELMEGYYDLPSTLYINSTTGDVTFRAYNEQEVHVTGGQRLRSSQFRVVEDPKVLQQLPQGAYDKVLELDLASANITDLGTLRPFGFNTETHMPLELFIGGKPLRLAEWPNNNFINIQNALGDDMFTYDSGARDRAWNREKEPWVYGWWYWSWADQSMPVSHVDTSYHAITLERIPTYGLRVGHYSPSQWNSPAGHLKQGGYFKVINMLCELDQPGEYYIDRSSKKLYVWPNTVGEMKLTGSDVIYASMVDDCITVASQDYTVRFEQFTLEACRRRGIELRGAQNIVLSGLEIKNTGGTAVHCTGDCRNISVLASDIHDVSTGISLSGGDRVNLMSSNNVIKNNHIWNYARYGAYPNDAVKLSGVGGLVSHNHIHHGQYGGILWRGNDHVIEYNHLHHICFNSSNCWAIRSEKDWTWRGNIIRFNHIHDVQRHFPGASVIGIEAGYGSTIEHNICYNNEVHINIGGGRDNVIRRNVLYNAKLNSIHVDARGLWSKKNDTTTHAKLKNEVHINIGGGRDNMIRRNVLYNAKQNSIDVDAPGLRSKKFLDTTTHAILKKSPYQTQAWMDKYPDLYNILDKHPEAPEGNQINKNIFYNEPGRNRIHYSPDSLRHRKDYFKVFQNYRTFQKGDFRWVKGGDFNLRCESETKASQYGFSHLPTLNNVGPTVRTGPRYLRNRLRRPQAPSSFPSCVNTVKPEAIPAGLREAYLPDGSIHSTNTFYPDIQPYGCWRIAHSCPQVSHSTAKHRVLENENVTEEECLAYAAIVWRRQCNMTDNSKVEMVYGPTGAMTFAAKGCYFADRGCHSGRHGGRIHHDIYGEKHNKASEDEEACLSRAVAQWRYCGSSADNPITSIFGPTGATRTAGTGCWIKMPYCLGTDILVAGNYIFDAWGEANRNTGTDREECLERAEAMWTLCNLPASASVTAFYRPTATNYTFP